MTLADDVRAFADLVTTSFDNATTTVETVHRGVAEMVLEVMTVVGLPSDAAEGVAARHQRGVGAVYGAVRAANHELGDLVVVQMDQLSAFADRIGLPLPDSPTAEVERVVSILSGRGRGGPPDPVDPDARPGGRARGPVA